MAIADRRLLVWFDAEYSDLELETAVLLQVAAIVTDNELKRIVPANRDVRLAIRLEKEVTPSRWIEDTLPDLLQACRSHEAVSIGEADDLLCEYVDGVVNGLARPPKEKPILAGNSVHFDWWLLARFLPDFAGRLDYRHLDVTALKLEWSRIHHRRDFKKEDIEMVRTYFPQSVLSETSSRHDAYYDAQASIAELAYYRKHLLRSAQ